MNWAPLAPLFVGLVLVILKAFFKGDKPLVVNGNPTYGYPKAGTYIMLVCAVVISLLPWILRDPDVVIAIPMGVAAVMLLFFIWAIRYRIVLDNDAVRSGSFFVRQFRYSDITHVKLSGTAVRGNLKIYSSSSRRPMTVWSTINGFTSFLDEINERLPKPAKIERLRR